jgi:hypothetical protein
MDRLRQAALNRQAAGSRGGAHCTTHCTVHNLPLEGLNLWPSLALPRRRSVLFFRCAAQEPSPARTPEERATHTGMRGERRARGSSAADWLLTPPAWDGFVLFLRSAAHFCFVFPPLPP